MDFFSFDLYTGTKNELAVELLSLNSDDCHVVYSLNPKKVMLCKDNDAFCSVIKKADVLIPDGNGIVYTAKKKLNTKISRLAGIDLFLTLCELSSKYGKSVYLYGSTQERIEKTVQALGNRFPNINIAGFSNGYDKNDDDLIADIGRSGADILFVGKGSPLQEQWIYENCTKLLGVSLIQAVGGSFDVVSGDIKRAPSWIINLNLEWLYRIMQQPFKKGCDLKMLLSYINYMAHMSAEHNSVQHIESKRKFTKNNIRS